MTTNLGRFTAAGVLVVGLAVLPRLAYWSMARGGDLATPDTAAYEQLAEAIREGRSYSSLTAGGPGGFPADLQRPPGYPLFLAMVGGGAVDRRWIVALSHVGVSAVLTVVIVLLGAAISSSRAGLFAGCFFALDWTSIVHTPLVMAETVYSLVLSTAVLAAVRACQARSLVTSLAAGGLFGLGALVKPAGQVVIAGVGVVLLLRGRKWRAHLVAVLGAFTAIVCPWVLRNRAVHGIADLSAIGTSALYFYTALGASEGIGFSPRELERAVNRADAAWGAKHLSPVERRDQLRQEAHRLLAGSWPVAAVQGVVGLARTALGTSPETVRKTLMRPHLGPWLVVLPLPQVIVLWAMAALGLIAGRRGEYEVTLVAVAVLALLLPSASPLGYSRYRVPAIPLLAVLAGTGVQRLLQCKARARLLQNSVT